MGTSDLAVHRAAEQIGKRASIARQFAVRTPGGGRLPISAASWRGISARHDGQAQRRCGVANGHFRAGNRCRIRSKTGRAIAIVPEHVLHPASKLNGTRTVTAPERNGRKVGTRTSGQRHYTSAPKPAQRGPGLCMKHRLRMRDPDQRHKGSMRHTAANGRISLR